MAYVLAMSGEMRDWLRELCATDPRPAQLVGRALTALIVHGADVGPPLLIAVAGPSQDGDLRDLLDQAYEDRLVVLQELRRRLAGAATLSPDVERMQREVDAIRSRKEVLRARYTSAWAQREIAELTADTSEAERAGRELHAVTAEIERELASMRPEEGLLELRAAEDGEHDIRMLVAAEPPGTVLLIAALEGTDAIADQRAAAVVLASDVLRRVRTGADPEASAHQYDLRSFVDEFFPGRGGQLMPRRPQVYQHGELVVVIDCSDLDRSMRFWTEVLGYLPGGTLGPYLSLLPADGNGIEVLLQRVPDRKRAKNRLHLDLRTRDVNAEVTRIRELGATMVTAEPIVEDRWRWYVLADPDGNEFCVIEPPPP